jgi:hypothetical protein
VTLTGVPASIVRDGELTPVNIALYDEFPFTVAPGDAGGVALCAKPPHADIELRPSLLPGHTDTSDKEAALL